VTSSTELPENRYKLVRLTLGPCPSVMIDHAEYSAIARAKQGVLTALALEEKFSLLLENYAEYESELLDVAVRSSIFSHQAWSEFQSDIHAVNRRLVNLLTATKLYADHVDHELIRLYGRGAAVPSTYRDERDKSRASVLSWRALELLRNVVQHRDFPIHELSLESSADRDDPDRGFVRHSVHPSIAVQRLASDRRMDARDRQTLVDLAAKGQNLQLTPMVREYVAAIARLHGLIRGAMAPDLDVWDLAISSALEKARAAFGDVFAVGAARIVECEDGEEEHDVVEIFDDPIKRRQFLAARTFRVQFLANGYVSSKPKPREA
jgi:hypothetical protein